MKEESKQSVNNNNNNNRTPSRKSQKQVDDKRSSTLRSSLKDKSYHKVDTSTQQTQEQNDPNDDPQVFDNLEVVEGKNDNELKLRNKAQEEFAEQESNELEETKHDENAEDVIKEQIEEAQNTDRDPSSQRQMSGTKKDGALRKRKKSKGEKKDKSQQMKNLGPMFNELQVDTNQGTLDTDPTEEQVNKYDVIKFFYRLMGSLFSLINLVGIYLYFFKQEFVSDTLYQTYKYFLVARIMAVATFSVFVIHRYFISYIRNPLAPIDPTNTDIDLTTRKRSMFFQGLVLYAHFPFMLFFGCYRLYKTKHFQPVLIVVAYLLELFLQIVPLLIIQLYTNDVYGDINDLRGLSVFAAVMGLLLIFEIIGETFILYKEIKQDQGDIQARSEFRKRAKNYQKSCLCSFVGILIFVTVITIGLVQFSNRQCHPGYGFDGGVCKSCLDSKCVQCSQNYADCEICKRGYFAGSIKTKNDESFAVCLPCDEKGFCYACSDDTNCLYCRKGTLLIDGKCVESHSLL